jgi:hypothetical protein
MCSLRLLYKEQTMSVDAEEVASTIILFPSAQLL